MPYNPLEDEKKPLTLREFIDLAKEELEAYYESWENANAWHRESHTWSEWFREFFRYNSW